MECKCRYRNLFFVIAAIACGIFLYGAGVFIERAGPYLDQVDLTNLVVVNLPCREQP